MTSNEQYIQIIKGDDGGQMLLYSKWHYKQPES